MQILADAALLNVEDVERSAAFYEDALGFEVVREARFEGDVVWCRIQNGPIGFMLNRPEGVDSAERRTRGSYRDAIFFFSVENAAAAHAELRAKGYAVDELKQQEYGREFHLRDPDGYELGFTDTVGAQ